MFKAKKNGPTIYKTYEDLMKAPIKFKSEYEDYYYIRVTPVDKYDNILYQVDKRTGKIAITNFTSYLASEVGQNAKALVNR